MLLVDSGTGLVVDANPAAEAFTGYTRQQLIGLNRTALHPESERGQLEDVYKRDLIRRLPCEGFHILRKDGICVPILLLSSGLFESNGGTLLICGLCDYTERENREHRFLNQNWALAAFAGATSVLGKARFSQDLLQAVCEAITEQSIYSLAWIVVAEDGPGNRIRIVNAAGSALSYLDEMNLSWSGDDSTAHGPIGVCIRTQSTQMVDDIEISELSMPWRASAIAAGLCSLIAIPFSAEGSCSGALIVGSSITHAFDVVSAKLFQHLVVLLDRRVKAFDSELLLVSELAQLEETQKQLTEALDAISTAMITAVAMLGPFVAGCQSRVEEVADAIARELDNPAA